MSNERCWHESLTGVDQTQLHDPEKVWRCDGCGVTGTESEMDALVEGLARGGAND